MKIEKIFEMWKEDVEIDKTELGDEALKIPKLHHKYYQIYLAERMVLRKLESDYKKMKLAKYEFYSDGPTEDTPKEWKLPAKGRILKADLPMYVEADNDIIDLSLRVGMQSEKVDALETIIKSINNRGYLITNGIQWIKFTSGG